MKSSFAIFLILFQGNPDTIEHRSLILIVLGQLAEGNK